jgi:hypothetical protein
MSRQATEWLHQNWAPLRRLTYTEPNGKERPAFEGDAAILASWLMDHLNQYGTFWHKAETLAEETGSAVRSVRRILAGWESIGVIQRIGTRTHNGRGRPSVEYAWKLGDLYKADLLAVENASIGAQLVSQLVSHGTSENDSKANKEKELTEIGYLEPEPEPQPEPATSSEAGGAWGIEHDQLLRDIMDCEDTSRDKGRLKGWLVKQYRPLVVRAIRDNPAPDLVAWCKDMKNGIEHEAEFSKQPCPVCHDYVFYGAGDPLSGKKAVWLGHQMGGWAPCINCQPEERETAHLRAV